MKTLLDLYSCTGGAALGYMAAGFDVTGVDTDGRVAEHYPSAFVQADVLNLDPEWVASFDVVHASPPCQAFSTATPDAHDHPDLIADTRTLLQDAGSTYIMENVPQAPLENYFQLCGSSFGLQVQRHRIFETSDDLFIWNPPSCDHVWDHGAAVTVTGHMGGPRRWTQSLAFIAAGRADPEYTRLHSLQPRDRDHAAELMGMPKGRPSWGYTEAIPPAYTEWIGSQIA